MPVVGKPPNMSMCASLLFKALTLDIMGCILQLQGLPASLFAMSAYRCNVGLSV